MNIITDSVALLDFLEAVNYYKNISNKLAVQFIDQVEASKKIIAKNPLLVPIKYDKIRVILLKQFPYHIHSLY
jgi:hypothetical protein